MIKQTLGDAADQGTVDASGILVEEGEAPLAFMFLRTLALECSEGNIELPCFPDVLIRIRRALANPKTTVTQLAKIIEVEPQLVTRLMHTANSAHFNPAGRPVRDLPAAMTRLGDSQVQSLTVAFSMAQVKQVKALQPLARELNVLWQHNMSAAVLAKLLAPRAQLHPDTAFLTGLLSGIGKLYIYSRTMALHPDLARSDEFLATVGSWHASIGKEVLTDWGFKEEAIAIGHQDDRARVSESPDLSDVLTASIALTDVLMEQTSFEALAPDVRALDTLKISPQAGMELLASAKTQLAATYQTLNS